MPPPSSYRHALMIVAATACWGVGTVLSKQVLDRDVQPLTLLAIELAASSLFLFLLVLLSRRRIRWSPGLARLAALGMLNPGLAYALGLLGLVSITASTSVLIWATEPVLILVLAALVLHERILRHRILAVTLTLLGMVLVVYRPGASGDAQGVALTVAAVAACAGYTVLTRRLLLDDSSLVVVLAQQVVALSFAVLLAGVVGRGGLGLPTDPITWALAGASGTIYYGLAFWFFVGGLRGVPASLAGVFLPLVPVFGLTAGYLVGDRFGARQWAGATLVLLAVLVAGFRPVGATAGAGVPGPPAGRGEP